MCSTLIDYDPVTSWSGKSAQITLLRAALAANQVKAKQKPIILAFTTRYLGSILTRGFCLVPKSNKSGLRANSMLDLPTPVLLLALRLLACLIRWRLNAK